MKKKSIASIAAIGIMSFSFSYQASAHELTYTVKSGDTLWKVASVHQLSVSELMRFNSLTSSMIHVGQELSLIAPHTHSTPISTYTVKSGDSLYTIARNHNLSVSELKSINQLSSDMIFVGQVLKVSNTNSAAPVQPTNENVYHVKSGDSLWKIANDNGLTVAQIKEYNQLTSDSIYVGQVLKLTSQVTVPPAPLITPYNADALIAEGKKYIGVPYVWAGSSPSGFDCSGFLNYVFNQVGVSIPRTVETIWAAGTPVSSPQKGDLVFFETYKPGPSHAGIYLGNNEFLHAGTSTGVTISDMNNSYWKPRYLGAKAVR
ncbi:LysM peptidoglycan-binding domain-containing protein [Bacillus dakarensis]|uniref:C40 family peptidase n=1 Tax=Robertmurraya dakarensis TaxID=1926278 RepID=UPI000980972C|nr:peptidoglycan endopeptidase [Bacillus dakarensis]